MFSTLGDFLQVEKFRILRSNAFASNSLSNLEKLLQRLFRCCNTGLRRGLFEPYACHEWYQCFKLGRKSIEDDPKCGRLSTSMDDDHVEKVLAVIRQNSRLTLHEVAEEGGICKRSCHLNLTDKLKMRRVAAKFVPRLLTDALLIREFFMKHEATLVPQPPYSPDLAPEDFFLFPKLKPSLKGGRFLAVEEIEENSLWDLRAIPQNTFQDALQNRKNHWKRCIKSGGEYFEGDKFD